MTPTATPAPRPETTRKRGRPELRPEQKAQMQARISAAAKELFRSEGYAKVSMRKIAKEIGCTPMALYRYYDAKIDILRSLWGDVFTELFQILDGLPAQANPKDRLMALGTAYTAFWLARSDYYRLVFMAEGVNQPEVSLFLGNPDIPAKYSIFLGAIREAAGANLPPEDLKAKLDFFLSALHGIAHNHITISGYEWTEPRAQISLAVKAVL